ncbi:MAG: hypothetical protein LBU81_07645 [Methanosarcinales archaeon]|jgi:TRAP-type C4-dicarboxylate transport system permease small subunit|nr:hypothetical protein [Methanosarcinales archaeon]
MSEKLSASRFSAKKFYAFIALGLIIFAAGTLFAYSADSKSDDLKINGGSAEEILKQDHYYAAAKILSFIGFLIALIPSVQILQHALLNENKKTAEKSNTCAENETADQEDD